MSDPKISAISMSDHFMIHIPFQVSNSFFFCTIIFFVDWSDPRFKESRRMSKKLCCCPFEKVAQKQYLASCMLWFSAAFSSWTLLHNNKYFFKTSMLIFLFFHALICEDFFTGFNFPGNVEMKVSTGRHYKGLLTGSTAAFSFLFPAKR